jgi:16S rRNA (adenine1518-N6/adenine1519-N6)-dimethyltransferase
MGQHFLGNLSWRKRILESLPGAGKETWIEIGAGHGEMTQLLAEDGRRVIAIEADPRLAAGLKANAATWGNVEIVEGNVLRLDLEKIAGGDFRVYGNLPYYITSPILHQLFTYTERLNSIHIVIQLEVAERIVAAPGRRDYGYLSAVCQFYTRPEIAFRIPPGAFRPPPRVTSALLHMTIPGEYASLNIADENRFIQFISTCFGQKRKTLRNNLLEEMPDEHIHGALADCGLRPDARAEQLSLVQFAKLYAWGLGSALVSVLCVLWN